MNQDDYELIDGSWVEKPKKPVVVFTGKLDGRKFKIIRMWAGISQLKLMNHLGLRAVSFLYELERDGVDGMPDKYVKALSELIGHDLYNEEVVADLMNNKIPDKYKDLQRRMRRQPFVF